MGNAVGRLTPCLCPAGTGAGDISLRHDFPAVAGNPLDDGLGHSFCYVRPDNFSALSSSSSSSSSCSSIPGRARDRANPRTASFFRTISGASISANTSTPLSTALYLDPYPQVMGRASSFESSPSFASVPLQPIPRGFMVNSGPLPARTSGSILGSGPIERGFLSGPIERGFTSGPIDPRILQDQVSTKSKYKWGSVKGIKDSILGSIWGPRSGKGYDSINQTELENSNSNQNNESIGKSSSISIFSGHVSGSLCEDNDGDCGGLPEGQNLQWAQGKAGEDRVHIVVSEDQGWVFVGIYDGFNGPDAPDFLLSNLYSALHEELKALIQVWNARSELESESELSMSKDSRVVEEVNHYLRRFSGMESTCSGFNDLELDNGDQGIDSNSNQLVKKHRCNGNGNGNGNANRNIMLKRNGTKVEILGYNLDKNKQILELDERIREKINQMGSKWSSKIRHSEVLKALSEALRKTEESYLDIADKMVKENPELCLMGSCVLVMLLMGEDIYLMNVGDSRAVLGQKSFDFDSIDDFPNVSSLQLTMDHNTYVKEEVKRIRNKHLDDPSAVVNHRVKGSLKVTRAFGAGFLKQPKWNEALLESFRIEYVGSSPYITCRPSLGHHRLGPRDRFLILSSDGLYQYFTNDEAVSEVELFMASTPEGDPAQHLIEEVLFRAAKRAGMDFHELLEIPQGERRRYHDDVSVIVISLEGTIWRSSV